MIVLEPLARAEWQEERRNQAWRRTLPVCRICREPMEPQEGTVCRWCRRAPHNFYRKSILKR